MAWTHRQIFIAILMVVTGSINTLSTKWADQMKSKNSDGKEVNFNHPFVQACAMFLGEFLCLVAFKILYYYYRSKGQEDTEALVQGNREFNPFIFLPAALLDMTATSVMYVGLNLTYPSSFQMLRGSVIVFVAILSILLLQRKIALQSWIGILLVIAGLAIVGTSDFLDTSNNSDSEYSMKNIITGDVLIVLAQIVTALQMVYEEKFVTNKDIPPLQAVGWEGVFGFVSLGILQVPMYYIIVGEPYAENPTGALENFPDAMVQLKNNPMIIFALCGTIISIAFFNFAGISITKEMSATTRMIIDSIRTIFIWLISLGLQWQDFYWLQIPGFIVLLLGMFVYNKIVPNVCCNRGSDSDQLIRE